MKRPSALTLVCAALLAAVGLAPVATPAQSVVYEFTALRGDVTACQWFDDNINDRSLDALNRQTDLLYNRLSLPPGAPVSVSQSATTAKGQKLVAFRLNGQTVCTGADAVYPPTPSPSPSSSAAPAPSPT